MLELFAHRVGDNLLVYEADRITETLTDGRGGWRSVIHGMGIVAFGDTELEARDKSYEMTQILLDIMINRGGWPAIEQRLNRNNIRFIISFFPREKD